MKYTIELKKNLLESGQVFEHTKARRQAYKGNSEPLSEFVETYGEDISKACRSIEESRFRKRKNIENRFNTIIYSSNAIFVTLTFDNETLSKTQEHIRRKYVQRFLKEQCICYVANIDYGDKEKNPESNEREHYHALVMTFNEDNKIDMTKWVYGYAYCKRVHRTKEDTEKISKYVAKLSQHALKKSTKLPRLIWSRGWKRFFKDDSLDDRLLPF